MKKLILLSAIVVAFSLLLLPKPVSGYYEQGTGGGVAGGNGQEAFEKKVYESEEMQNASHVNVSQENSVVALTHRIIGCTTEECKNKLQANSGGAVGSFADLTSNMYTNPPASSYDYIASLRNKLNIAKPAYAREAGFVSLRPILPLWQICRNIAYIFFTLIFVVVGFAIMLRVKISPQATITIQNAIPQIVITLILVTFSYAIAGFLVDLSYLFGALAMNVIDIPSDLSLWEKGLAGLTNEWLSQPNPGILNFTFRFWVVGGKAIHNLKTIFSPVTYFSQYFPAEILEKISDTIAGFISPQASLTALILSLILLFVFFKIFINLVVCYVKVILHIVSAPIQLMIGAIPGRNTFGNWLKNIAQNLLPFPAILIMLKISNILTNSVSNLWTPPIIGSASNIGPQKYLPAILGFGMLVLTAQVPDIIKSMFAGEGLPRGLTVGRAIGLTQTVKTGQFVGQTAQILDDVRRRWRDREGGKVTPERNGNDNSGNEANNQGGNRQPPPTYEGL